MNKKTLGYLYIFIVHVLLVFFFAKPDSIENFRNQFGVLPVEIDDYQKTLLAFHVRINKNLPPGIDLFFGDSHVQGLAVSAVSNNAVNFGIAGETTLGLLERLPKYDSINTARSVVIAVGYNDIKRRANAMIYQNVRRILDSFPSKMPIVLNMVFPVFKQDNPVENERINSRIRELNASLRDLSNRFGNVYFLEFPDFYSKNESNFSDYYLEDGVHLNASGYEIWIKQLRQILLSNLGFFR